MKPLEEAVGTEQEADARGAAGRLAVQLEAIAAAAGAGLKDHDRWPTLRKLLARKLDRFRFTSRLPALIDYVLTRAGLSRPG